MRQKQQGELADVQVGDRVRVEFPATRYGPAETAYGTVDHINGDKRVLWYVLGRRFMVDGSQYGMKDHPGAARAYAHPPKQE